MEFNFFGYKFSIKSANDQPVETVEVKTSSYAQRSSAAKATAKRSRNAKFKIIDAVSQINQEKGKLSMYNVAKVSGCSINTVKKYKKLIKEY